MTNTVTYQLNTNLKFDKMKKFLPGFLLMVLISATAMAQSIDNNFFKKVSYVGAFDGYDNWTEGWTNWTPVDTDYPDTYTMTKGNGQFTNIGGVHIVADETWSGVVKLDGWIYVDNGATLTIEPGTIIRGTNKSVLTIAPGGKIMAAGTRTLPIVFTSSQGAGFRGPSDWGGLVVCGKAPNNLPGGVGIAEGGIGTEYGGSDAADNSGVLTFVRIEFPGFEVATGSEVNGLTLNSVGAGTRIENIQVSYSGDDGYEWFGGTVNAKYLISYRTEDDDFDTDNGFSGMVQFAVILRDPEIVDSDTANGFESDNDKDGSVNNPFTKAIFSNISGFGSAKDLATYNALPQNHKEGSSFRIRRSSRISVYNSLFMGWGRGVRLESTATHNAATANDMTIKNTIIASIYGNKFHSDNAVLTAAQIETWFLETTKRNKVIENGADVKIMDPFNLESPNFQPQSGSPVFNASYWYKENEPVSIDNSFFEKVSYVGAFDGYDNWTEGWTNWTPVDTDYPETYTMTKGNGQFTNIGGVHIVADETWSGVVKLDGWIYVDNGATLTIEPGTIIRGTNKSVLTIAPGGKIMAAGTRTLPIVFTSSQGAGFRGPSDWGGLVVCGKAPNNLPGGVGIAEGGIGTEYGGSDAADNSGVLTFVRIEFPGFEVATGSEVNGLTLNSVGAGTRIENIQVSYSGDDGYEWFGGTVNAKYLISYRTEDDDFDTDNGFSGMVQFAVILRDPEIVDSDTANGFESDNDKDGSVNSPFTKAIFSNISGFGSAKDLATYNALPQNHKEGSSFRIRRSSRISVYNSLFMGWGRGVRLESTATHNAATANDMTIRNTIIASIYGNKFHSDNAVMTAADIETWFLETTKRNKVIENGADVKIMDPFNLESPNFQPESGSPVFNASYWTTTSSIKIKASDSQIIVTSYPNPFNGSTNIELTLTKDAPVRVMVYNLAGALVSEIHNGELFKGTHRFRFDAKELPKGMYFGKVIVENQTQTLKMVAQ
jgi:hypothetical protein